MTGPVDTAEARLLASTLRGAAYVSPPRDPQRYMRPINCGDVLDAVTMIETLLAERDALRAALRVLVDACEADFGIYDDDDESVALMSEGPSALTFPMIRAGRAALKGTTP